MGLTRPAAIQVSHSSPMAEQSSGTVATNTEGCRCTQFCRCTGSGSTNTEGWPVMISRRTMPKLSLAMERWAGGAGGLAGRRRWQRSHPRHRLLLPSSCRPCRHLLCPLAALSSPPPISPAAAPPTNSLLYPPSPVVPAIAASRQGLQRRSLGAPLSLCLSMSRSILVIKWLKLSKVVFHSEDNILSDIVSHAYY
jgi:hypothetical protein